MNASKLSGSDALSWDRDGADWPNRRSSQFVETRGLRWHVQRMGRGPAIVLVHGLGAATHSWRDLAPLLAERFEVVAPDLPGHGFTQATRSGDLSLSGMARALVDLLGTLNISPALAVGHSAGAAILARACIDRKIQPKLLVGINGALLPFPGVAGYLFPPIAKLLHLNPLVPRLIAWSSDRHSVTRLLRGTGSSIDARGVDLYARLLRNRDHVDGALGMMAAWDLGSLSRDLHRLTTPLALVVGLGDRAVPPETANEVAVRLPLCRVERLSNVGHLAHEEKPEIVRDTICRLADDAGIRPDLEGPFDFPETRPTGPAQAPLRRFDAGTPGRIERPSPNDAVIQAVSSVFFV